MQKAQKAPMLADGTKGFNIFEAYMALAAGNSEPESLRTSIRGHLCPYMLATALAAHGEGSGRIRVATITVRDDAVEILFNQRFSQQFRVPGATVSWDDFVLIAMSTFGRKVPMSPFTSADRQKFADRLHRRQTPDRTEGQPVDLYTPAGVGSSSAHFGF